MLKAIRAIGSGLGVVFGLFLLGSGMVGVAEAGIPHSSQVAPVSIATVSSSAAAKVSETSPADHFLVPSNGGKHTSSLHDPSTLTPPVESADLKIPGVAQLQMQVQSSTSLLSFTTKSLATGAVGVPYGVILSATGGTQDYTWSLSSGKMPAGLSLAPATGIISGTPTASGTFSLGITLSDSSQPVQQVLSVVTITVTGAPLSILTTSLQPANLHMPYLAQLQASGGTPPAYTWAITSGSLPLGFLLAPTTGQIYGRPAVTGTFSFGVTVTDSGNPAQSKSGVVTVVVPSATPAVAAPLVIAASALAPGIVGSGYSQTLQATGGTPVYTWSIASGSLPAGITLSGATGALSGTPTASGTFSFTAAVRDSGATVQTQSVPMSLVIAPAPLKIMTATLPSATDGTAYTQSLQATGGTPNYKWSIASGQLPAGLLLNPTTGTIIGMPLVSGSSTFTAAVSDSGSPVQATSAPITIAIAPSAVVIAPFNFPPATVGVVFSQTLRASGGIPTYQWSVSQGSLPAGLTLSAAGVISGAPTASGTSSFTVTVRDSGDPAQMKSMSGMQIVVSPAPLKITPVSLAAGTSGAAYSQALTATGGTPGYTWSVRSGSLPTGLTLASATGILSGTPTVSGTSTFTVTATDSGRPAQTASATTSIVVAASPLKITAFTPSSTVTVGGTYSQALQASGGTKPYTWSISSGQLPAGLSLSPSTGTISGTVTASGVSTFTASVRDSGNPAQTQSVSMTVVVAATPLTITAFTPSSTVTVGGAYSQSLQANGGTTPYTWSISSGQLPAGLSISPSTGTISGTVTTSGTSTFTASVHDSGNPVQTQSASVTVVVAATPLTIVASTLPTGTSSTAYATSLQATGGTPAYTWSITSGSLPPGLTLAGTTGVISGTPSASGSWSFTASVHDNGSPVQTASVSSAITVAGPPAPTGPGTTWFVRPDGGTRYSANMPNGQCDGQADTAYPGTGTNQHCSFVDVRYMWMDGTYGNSSWVMAGGDTLVIRGCTAAPGQQNPDNPHCRIGWDKATGNDSQNFWCAGVSAFWGCSMPPPPNGSATQHTKILGGCAYGTYSCTPVIGYPYTGNNLTQLFGGFASGAVMYLSGSQYVDVEGLEITSHNGACSTIGGGGQQYPSSCSSGVPVSDSANWGVVITNTSSNILLQDLYIHGFTNLGIGGPLGGPTTLNRVSIDFNAFAGWNFDDGIPTPDAPGSSLTQSYVTMVGNGCLEEYPIVHTQYPAKSCWDQGSGGFGDAWSGQASLLSSFTCDHCNISYNMKDGAMGPHSLIHNLKLTNSVWIGNMGQSGKWGQDAGSTFLFENNLMVGNCMRLSQQLPGAAQNFNITTGLPGSYLSTYCRAGGPLFDYFADTGSSVNFTNNTFIAYQPIFFEMGCNTVGGCLTTPYNFTNNIVLGYMSSYTASPFNPGTLPDMYYFDWTNPVDMVSSRNIEYGIKSGDVCGTNGILCVDPLLTSEPSQTWISEATLDVFNPFAGSGNSFYPSSTSPAVRAGTAISGLTTDYYGIARPNPPSIGGVEP